MNIEAPGNCVTACNKYTPHWQNSRKPVQEFGEPTQSAGTVLIYFTISHCILLSLQAPVHTGSLIVFKVPASQT